MSWTGSVADAEILPRLLPSKRLCQRQFVDNNVKNQIWQHLLLSTDSD